MGNFPEVRGIMLAHWWHDPALRERHKCAMLFIHELLDAHGKATFSRAECVEGVPGVVGPWATRLKTVSETLNQLHAAGYIHKATTPRGYAVTFGSKLRPHFCN